MSTKLRPEVVATAVAVAIVAIAAFAWNRSSTGEARQELTSVPGAAVSREGVSTQAQLFNEALTLMGRRNFLGAESVYREVLQREPMSAPAYMGLGTSRFHQNDLVGAQQNYRRALELDPASTGAALGLGSVAYQQRRYAVAAKYYRQALAAKTSQADAHWGLGLTYDAIGKKAEATKHYAAFLRLAPDAGQAGVARARMAELESSRTH